MNTGNVATGAAVATGVAVGTGDGVGVAAAGAAVTRMSEHGADAPASFRTWRLCVAFADVVAGMVAVKLKLIGVPVTFVKPLPICVAESRRATMCSPLVSPGPEIVNEPPCCTVVADTKQLSGAALAECASAPTARSE